MNKLLRNVNIDIAWVAVPVLLLAVSLPACVSTGASVYKNVRNPVVVTSSRSMTFDHVSVWQSGRLVMISGRVEPKRYGQQLGHVDVALSDQHGNALRAFSIPVKYRYYRARWLGAFFKARLTIKLPANVRIRLVLHDAEKRSGGDSGIYQCERNRALSDRGGVGHAQ